MRFEVGDLVRRRNPRQTKVGIVVEVSDKQAWVLVQYHDDQTLQPTGDIVKIQ